MSDNELPSSGLPNVTQTPIQMTDNTSAIIGYIIMIFAILPSLLNRCQKVKQLTAPVGWVPAGVY